MNKTELVFKYALFAGIASASNILIQCLSMFFYNGFLNLYVAIFLGTLAGLLAKYLLDKKFIFYYQTKDKKQDFRKFIFYSGTGIITTTIFWGFELGFNYFLGFENAKFIGAGIGLAIGYFIKYNLDKNFVFVLREKSENE